MMRLSFFYSSPVKVMAGSKVVCSELFGAMNPLTQASGLMFRRLNKGQGMLFAMGRRQVMSLHMFFVFSSIDVVFGDYDDRKQELLITDVKEEFRPFRLFTSSKPCNCFLELACGEAKDVRPGHKLLFERSESPKTI